MTVLVTGSGIIGTETAKLLADRGSSVVMMDLAPNPSTIDLVVGKGRYIVEYGDVNDDTLVDEIIRRHKITDVVHTAAMLSRGATATPRQAFRTNFGSTVSFLDRQRLGEIRRVVISTSTMITYPLFSGYTVTPIPEDYSFRLLSQSPKSIYPMTKLCAELALLSFRDCYGLDAVALRYSAVIGASPTGSIGVPSRFLKRLLDAGSRGETAVLEDAMIVWEGGEEFVDVRDVARANLCALDAINPMQGVYHITGKELYTIDDFIDAVRELYPTLDVRFDTEIKGPIAGLAHPRPGPSDTSAASSELGFDAIYGIQDSMKYIAELLNHRPG